MDLKQYSYAHFFVRNYPLSEFPLHIFLFTIYFEEGNVIFLFFFIIGGDTITIKGDGFGNVEQPVLLGGVKLVVNTYNNQSIVAKLPPLPDGSYQIIIDVKDKGYADLRCVINLIKYF